MNFADLYALQQTLAEDIPAFLTARQWTRESHRALDDLRIERWAQIPNRIIVEYGPDYDTSVIYRTPNAANYRALAREAGVDALTQHAQKTTPLATYTAYRDGDDIVILGEPQPGSRIDDYTVIVTTLSNIDALWFESEYIQ